MYKITNEIAQAFRTERALARIGVELVSGAEIDEITEHDIDTLSIERAAVSGNVIEIGAARLFELKLRLNNAEKKFDDVQFDGSHLRVRTGVKKSNGVELVPMGLFIVDGHEEDNGDIILTAFDYMVKFDRDADYSGVIFPTTPAKLIRRACDKCGVDPSRLDFSKLPNADYEIKSPPESAVSWRSVIMWCCQILGACAFTDAEGYLIVKWYTDTGEKLTPADRFSHKLFLKDVTVKGVEVVTDEAIYRAGSDEGFIFSIEENELITHDFDSVARNLGTALIGFTHRPFSAPTLPLPHLFPLDMMTYVTPNGEELAVCVSSYKFTLNGQTELKGVGESETTSGFATLNPLTENQKAVIAAGLRKVEQSASEEISEAEASLLRLNEVIGNALGLYLVTHTEEDGSTQIYFCDKPTLEKSGLIYAFNAGGFAWATQWRGSNAATVWNYGITRDGNAVLNYLTLNKLTAEQVSVAEIVGAINESSGDSALVIGGDHIAIQGESLETVIGGLVTTDGLNHTLESYMTGEEVRTTLESYVPTTGESESFAYTMTSKGLTLTANGSKVLIVDKDGLIVNGTIYAEGGTIAGLIIERAELTDNDTVYVQKSIRTPSDDFHILIKENETGKALSSEIAITSLICNSITAREGIGKIDLNYHLNAWNATATLTTDSFIAGNNVFVTLTVSVSPIILCDTTFSIEVKGTNGSTFTRNITVKNGERYEIDVFYYSASIGFSDANFTDTETKTKSFVTAYDYDHFIGITESIIPTEDAVYNFGRSSNKWNEGYFKSLDVSESLKVRGSDVAVPAYTQTAKTGYVAYSSGNSYSSGTWTDISGAQITSIYLANFRIITVRSYTTLGNDRWARINLSEFCSKIYGVTVTASSSWGVSSLSGSKYGASFIIARSDDATTIYIGVDENTATGGFEATIIARV